MLALVLSGGGNYGPLQAGALEVLFESGIQPKMVVGTSAGSINAIHIAAHPSLEGAKDLGNRWRDFAEFEAWPSWALAIKRAVTGEASLFPNEPLIEFMIGNAPQAETFGELADLSGVRAYTTAVCLETQELEIFGDRDDDLLMDGVMASTAFYPFLPPWKANGKSYLDGGLATTLPIRVAAERGATRIIALDIDVVTWKLKAASNILRIGTHALALALNHQKRSEVAWTQLAGVALKVIDLPAPKDVAIWDYNQADRLVNLGRELAIRSLRSEPLLSSLR